MPYSFLFQSLVYNTRVFLIICDILAYLSVALFGKYRFRAALNDVRYAVEFGALTSVPQRIDLDSVKNKFLRYDGISASGTRKTCRLGEGTKLYRASSRALNLEYAGRQTLIAYKRFVRAIEDYQRLLSVGVIHPSLQLLVIIHRARWIVGRTNIYYISLIILVRHRFE